MFRLVILVIAVLFASPASASPKLVAVLPLDTRATGDKLTSAAQLSLEEMLRDSAMSVLAPTGWTVLTGETTLQVLTDNGIRPEDCAEQTCHLSVAREIKASIFLSGSVQQVEGQYTASIRVFDTRTGRALAVASLMGKSVLELRKDFASRVEQMFKQAGILTSVGDGSTHSSTRPSTLQPEPGTLYDRHTGRTWLATPPRSERDWEAARRYCAELGAKWRLPTTEEFKSAFDKDIFGRWSYGYPTHYWTSDTFTQAHAYSVSWRNGSRTGKPRSVESGVRCVK